MGLEKFRCLMLAITIMVIVIAFLTAIVAYHWLDRTSLSPFMVRIAPGEVGMRYELFHPGWSCDILTDGEHKTVINCYRR